MDTTFFTSVLSDTDYRIFDITSKVISVGLAKYIGIGLTIYITIEIIKMMFLRQPMDLPNIFVALIIAYSFSVYSDVAKMFDQEMNAIYSSIRGSAGEVNVALAKGTYGEQVKDELAQYQSTDDKMDMFDEFFTGSLSNVIYMIMSGLRKALLLFMYAIGPVCMVLSMFPIFGIKVLKNWFFYLLSVHLWELGFIVLQIIQSQIGYWRGVEGENGLAAVFSGNGWAWACYNVTNFICFAMVPYLTGKMMIGLSQPSSFGTRVLGAAAMVTRGAVGKYQARQAARRQSGEGLGNSVKSTVEKVVDKGGGVAQSGYNSAMRGAGKLYGNVTKNFKSPPVT